MPRKIQLAWGGGMSDVVFSLVENKFFDYELDNDALHAKYGGKNYYRSGSGLSGAGYLQPTAAANDLIKWGTYRTDIRGFMQKIETVHITGGEYDPRPIFGYAPTSSHKGIQPYSAFVLTDGETVALAYSSEVSSFLHKWSEIKAEARQISTSVWWWNGYLTSSPVGFGVYNPSHFKGVDAMRFVDLRRYRPDAQAWQAIRAAAGPTIYLPTTAERLGLTQTRDLDGFDCWLHMDRHGIFDAKVVDPFEIVGEVVDGWIGDGDGLVWRRQGPTKVFAMWEVWYGWLVETFPNLNLAFAGQPAWIEFEAEFSALDWFGMDAEARTAWFLEKLVEKARSMVAFSRVVPDPEELSVLYALDPTVRITLQDSYTAGNCEPGTLAFVKRYGIELDADGGTTMGELMENGSFQQMLTNPAFARVLAQVLKPASGGTETAEAVTEHEDNLGPTVIERLEQLVAEDEDRIDPALS